MQKGLVINRLVYLCGDFEKNTLSEFNKLTSILMKKIGILFGMEETFPKAFVDRVNSKNVKGIVAEAVSLDKVIQGEASDYAVIIDRISQDVPFYRAMLKNAAISGTAVINNPFWWSADEKFFNNALAVNIGVPVPKTALIPSHDRPDDTTERSFRNLKFPFDWETIFNYTGFPAYMKPFAGGGWKSVYKINDIQDFFTKHRETGQLVMMLQEEIVFEEYYRCYCIGGKYVKIMPYEPRNPHHLRYVADFKPSAARLKEMEEIVLRINHYLGYDFNTVELAVRDGIPYAIDFCNPAPDAEASSVGEENFEWVVETSAKYAIEKAQAHKAGQDNLTWGQYISRAVNKQTLYTPAKKAAAAKSAAKPAAKTAKATTPKSEVTKTASPKAKVAKTAAPKEKAVKAPKAPKVPKAPKDSAVKTTAKAAAPKTTSNETATKTATAKTTAPKAASKPKTVKPVKAATKAPKAPKAPKAEKPATKPKATTPKVKAEKPATKASATKTTTAKVAAPKAEKPAAKPKTVKPKAEKPAAKTKVATPKTEKPAAQPKVDAPKADAKSADKKPAAEKKAPKTPKPKVDKN
jgi:hypothetical protein